MSHRSRECAAGHEVKSWIASSQELLAMTG
jgi:hypothetical protein